LSVILSAIKNVGFLTIIGILAVMNFIQKNKIYLSYYI
jgi:hypothetical protein